MVDGLRIEASENGWELVIEGDMMATLEEFVLNAADDEPLRLNIQAVAFEFAGSSGLLDLHEWRAEGLAAKASRLRDDGDGYALDDPKHPTYHERMSEAAEAKTYRAPYDPQMDHPERYRGNNPWRPI